MNPLKKARYRTAESLRTARDGTTRTARWVGNGVAGGAKKTWSSATGVVRRGDEKESKPASSESSDASGGIVTSIRENPRVAIAWAAVALVVVAWIAWTVYIWIENGSTAGVGVLVSWPAAIAALALVAAPFVAATLLVKRLSADGGPQMAGAAGVADAPAAGSSAVTEEKAEDDDAEPDENEEKGEKEDDADEAEEPEAEASDDDASDDASK